MEAQAKPDRIIKSKAIFLLDYPRIKSHSSGMDFLRGLLAIWVMLAHLSIWGGMANQQICGSLLWAMEWLGILFQPVGETHPAVVGFIVLSGYCIHRNGARRESFNILSYGVRRAFRIVPTYLLASVVGAVGFAYLAGIDSQTIQMITGTSHIRVDGLVVKLLGISAIIPNLHYLGFQGNAPLTTVMVEIWLYLFYAIAMRRLVLGMNEAMLWKIILVLWCSVVAIISGYANYYSWWNNGSLIAFLPYWWLGATAVNKSDDRPLLNNWKLMTMLYLLFTVAITSGVLHGIALFLAAELRKLVLAVLFAQLIASIDGARGRIINWGAKIGQASYSIYAYHAPILAIALVLALPWWLAPWLVVVVAIAVYVIFEAPLTAMGKRLAIKIGK